MDQRERLTATLNFDQTDRLPMMDFGYWEQTIENWQKEGMPPQVENQKDVENYLSLDRCCFDTHLEVPQVNYKGAFFPLFEETIIDEDEKTVTKIDSYGVMLRESKKKNSVPKYIRFPVEKKKDFSKLKPRLDGKNPRRYPPDWSEQVKVINAREEPVGLFILGFFGHPLFYDLTRPPGVNVTKLELFSRIPRMR